MPIVAQHSRKVPASRRGNPRSHPAFPIHLFACVLLGALRAVATALGATPVGTGFQVDTPRTSSQNHSSVAVDAYESRRTCT